MDNLQLPALRRKFRAPDLPIAHHPLVLRFGPLIIRAAALILFAMTLYNTEYSRARDFGFPANTRMQATIRAANLGEYFYFYGGDDTDTRETLDPELIGSWTEVFEDYGLHILVVLDAIVGQSISGDDYHVTQETVYQVLFALFVMTALVFAMPNLPLPLSLAGILALWCSIRFGPVELSFDARGWGATYAAILIGMAVLTAPLVKRRAWSMIYWLALSTLIAFSLLMRQEVITSIYGSMLALMLAAGLVGCVAYFVLSEKDLWKRTALVFFSRVAIAAATVIAAVIVLPYMIRAMYAISWDVPYSETVITQHGASPPLYLSLGFVSNPYNIVWLDPVAAYHAELYDPEVRVWWRDLAIDAPLTEGVREIAGESPWLFMENFAAKTEYAHRYLWDGEPPRPNAYPIVQQTDTLQILYRFALVIPVLMLGVAIYRKDLTMLVILAGGLALAIGAASGAVLIFPSYIGGAQGIVIVSVILLPAALAVRNTDWQPLPTDAARRIMFWTLGSSAAIILLGGILAGGWVLLRWNAHQDELDHIAAADPLSEIQQLEFRYGHTFNQLEPDEQEVIIAKLRASDSPTIALPDSESDFGGMFQPQLAIMTTHQLHLIVWLGSDYPGAIDYINQGQVYSVIQACSGCEEVIRDYSYQHTSLVYAFLNDTDWNDGYRMLSLAVDPEDFQQAGFFQVLPQRIRFNGGRATDFNFMVDELAEGIRLDWNPAE